MKPKCSSELIKVNNKHYPCGTSITMDFIGGKWKAVILAHLADKVKRYNALRKELPAVTERSLSLQLKQLEKDGFIERRCYNSKPPLIVEYEITELGKSMIPVIKTIEEWGCNYARMNGGEIVKQR